MQSDLEEFDWQVDDRVIRFSTDLAKSWEMTNIAFDRSDWLLIGFRTDHPNYFRDHFRQPRRSLDHGRPEVDPLRRTKHKAAVPRMNSTQVPTYFSLTGSYYITANGAR